MNTRINNLYDKNMYYCKMCKSFKTKELYCFAKGKSKYICKKCHASREKNRRLEFTEEQKIDNEKRAKLSYEKQRYNFSCLDKTDPKLIHKWVNRNKSRKDLKSKKIRRLEYNFLKKKLEEAMKIFPYMILRKTDGPKAFLASIDRIDPTLDYSEDNVVVVPLWFNSGKLDLQINEFLDMIKGLSDQESICDLYKKELK